MGEMISESDGNSLMELTFANVEFFRDIDDEETYYARFVNKIGKTFFTRIDSLDFKSFIRVTSKEFDEDGLYPEAAIQAKLDFFTMYHQPPKIRVFRRVAGDLTTSIDYALFNDNGQVIHMDMDGWNSSRLSGYYFLRSKTALAQKYPQRAEKKFLEYLSEYANLDEDDLKLLAIAILQLFVTGNHHILFFTAERGAGKTTLMRLISALVDPSSVNVTAMPTKKDDLQTLLANRYLACFDNAGTFSTEVSDILCRAVSGTTATKRALYTCNDLTVQRLHNAIMINGIKALPREPDLVQRSLVFRLKKREKFSSTRVIEAKIAADVPFMLEAAFSVLSKAIETRKKLGTLNLPRMSDAYEDMAAIALAMDIPLEEFDRIYSKNSALTARLTQNPPVVDAVVKFMRSVPGRSIQGSVARIYDEILKRFDGDPNDLPGSPSAFSAALDKEAEAFRNAGLRINMDDTGSTGTSLKIIKKK